MYIYVITPIRVDARSKAWTVSARWNTGIVGSNPTRGMDVCVRLLHVRVFLCIGRGVATAHAPSKESYRQRNWKSGQSQRKGCRAIIITIMINDDNNNNSSYSRVERDTGKHVFRLLSLIRVTWNSVLSVSRQVKGAGIATNYGLDDQGFRVRVPVGWRISSCLNRPDRLWGPPNLLSNG
jgi:hypothetical protein